MQRMDICSLQSFMDASLLPVIFFCFAKTKEQVVIPEKEKISIKVQLKAVMQNKPYLLALVGQVLFGFTLYGRNADILYYFTYVEGNASYYTTYSMCIIIPFHYWCGMLSASISEAE